MFTSNVVRPVVPYKASFQEEPNEPRDFFNAFSADDSTGHVSASSPTDPHRDSGPVVLAVVLIVGVVFLFFTCITCCTVGGSTSNSTDSTNDLSGRHDLEGAIAEQVAKQEQNNLLRAQGLRRYNTAPPRQYTR